MITVQSISLVRDGIKVATFPAHYEVTSFRKLNTLRKELSEKYKSDVDFIHRYELSKNDHRITRYILLMSDTNQKDEKKNNS